MSFIVEWYSQRLAQITEDPKVRADNLNTMLEHHFENKESEARFSQMRGKPKTPFAHLKSHPVYEQRTKMYAHKAYIRREDA
jgi:hypothetical protein